MFDWFVRDNGLALRWIGRLVGLHRSVKVMLLVTMDALLCVASVWISFSLRVGEWNFWNKAIATFGLVALSSWLLIFSFNGIYRSVARFIGSRTILKIGSSCCLIMLVLIGFFSLTAVEGVPRTIPVIHPLVFGALLVISRVTIRYVLFDFFNQKGLASPPNRVLIYGAGTSGRQLASSLRHEPTIILRGFIDDDVRLNGQLLDGVRVYRGDRVDDCFKRFEIDTILIAIPSLSRSERARILDLFEGHSVKVMTLPNVQQFVDGNVTVSDLRDVEVQDLLGRDPVPANAILMSRVIQNKTIMITGAGGSIGSELCRKICKLSPERIVLVEMTEHALYAIESELRQMQSDGEFAAAITIATEMGNITDGPTVERLFSRWHPQTVFHAAAYKHVPLVESNVIAGLWNNVFGTMRCALAAERAGVANFILVSTDKAVRPTNVMGASKRVCELILQALADRDSSTKFAMVRFGNVLGSSGSVVPRFQSQIRSGGPVTLTHADITRYFMTIPEAAQLVIQAGAMARGGEVYLLDMGDPVRIYDLARSMINLSGLTVRDASHPEGDIEIVETGLRPGEKLYEELLIDADASPTSHPQIFQARENHLSWVRLSQKLDSLEVCLRAGNALAALAELRQLVPEYVPATLDPSQSAGLTRAG